MFTKRALKLIIFVSFSLIVIWNYTLSSGSNKLSDLISTQSSKKILLYHKFGARKATDKTWTDTVLADIVFGKCSESRCILTIDRSELHQVDAVLFDLFTLIQAYTDPDVSILDLPSRRPPETWHQIWILAHYDAMINLEMRAPDFPFGSLNHIFNWSMSLRRDSEIRIRFGAVDEMLQELTQQDADSLFSPWDTKVPFSAYSSENLAPVAWLSSHCHTYSGREAYVEELGHYIGIDIYGKCGPKQCMNSRYITNARSIKDEPCFEMINEKYAFIVAFENALCTDYVTEKVFNGLLQNAIPLVLSGQLEDRIFPPHSVIFAAHFQSPREMAEYLHYLLSNETAYREYFMWRRKYKLRSFFSVPDSCELCEKLYSETVPKEKSSGITANWLRNGTCVQPKSLMNNWTWEKVVSLLEFHVSVPEDDILNDWLLKHRARIL